MIEFDKYKGNIERDNLVMLPGDAVRKPESLITPEKPVQYSLFERLSNFGLVKIILDYNQDQSKIITPFKLFFLSLFILVFTYTSPLTTTYPDTSLSPSPINYYFYLYIFCILYPLASHPSPPL